MINPLFSAKARLAKRICAVLKTISVSSEDICPGCAEEEASLANKENGDPKTTRAREGGWLGRQGSAGDGSIGVYAR